MATQAEKLKAYREAQDPNFAVLSRIQFVKGDVGPQGPQGAQGTPGRDGADGRDGETVVGPQGPQGDRGATGRAGNDGKDGKDGKNGRDGKNPAAIDPQTIIDAVLAQITSGKKLKAEHIDGLAGNLAQLKDYLKLGGFRGGAGTIVAGSNVTVTHDVNGNPVIAASGGGGTAVYNEIVAGSVNTFTLAHAPIAGTGRVYAIGQRLTPTTDYTILGSIITTVSAWNAGDIVADYQY